VPAEHLAGPATAGTTPAPPHRAPDDSQVVLAHIMSDHDTNLYGTVHGGTVMKLIDDAAAAAAGRHAGTTAVTVSVEDMRFLTPVRTGDLLTVRARLDDAGRTSMQVGVEVTAERWNATGPTALVATGHLVFVAVDDEGHPVPVPELRPVTEDDLRRRRRAAERRERRGAGESG